MNDKWVYISEMNRSERKQLIDDLLNCWEYTIKRNKWDIIDVTNTILIVTDKNVESLSNTVCKVIDLHGGDIKCEIIKTDNYCVIIVNKYFKNVDCNILLKFKIILFEYFNNIKGKYSCILVDINKDKFNKKFNLDKANKISNKELNNMFLMYGIINLY